MHNDPATPAISDARPKGAPRVFVLAGIILGQALLYGPSLLGFKVLLPVDLLAREGYYLPQTPGATEIEPQNLALSDLVDLFEPARRFAVTETHAGRMPLWAPYQFGGVPFIWPKFSPFLAFQCLTASPVILAWSQLLAAVVAGLGAYCFCRRALDVGFWPAAIAGWCYPLTGFFVLWQGFPTALSVYWLPWLLLAVDRTTRNPTSLAPPGLAVAVTLTLVSGHPDVAGQVLLVGGLYAAWCLWDTHMQPWATAQGRRAAATLLAAVGLGCLFALPYVLPVMEYTRTSARMARRTAGQEERPPIGLSTLPQVVLPELYGSSQTGSVRIDEGIESESAAAAYTGVLATLLFAPLAWCSRRHRRINAFWCVVAFLGLAWCLNAPIVVPILRLPGLNLLSHNRLVFATSFAILALMAIGLDQLARAPLRWRGWFWVPTLLLAALCFWCVYRTNRPPAAITDELEGLIAQGGSVGLIHDLHGVRRVQAWFVEHYAAAALICALGLAGWVALPKVSGGSSRLFLGIGAVLLADLLWFAHGRSPQCDPALYYPALPALQQVAASEPGRVIGYHCLPASLASLCGLQDIRGYDGVDPGRMVELISLAADAKSSTRPYAETQWLTPRVDFSPEGRLRLPPVLNMLGVRYVIFRNLPTTNAQAAFHSPGYWVFTNGAVLPRAFVPRHVEVVADLAARLQRLAAPDFKPRDLALIEAPVALPETCRGSAAIVQETPIRLVLTLQMETDGLVVVPDTWDCGWRAVVDGRPVPVLRVNHAVRGVVVPAGAARLEFRYAPASLSWGLRLAGAGAVMWLAWFASVLRRRSRSPAPGELNGGKSCVP